MTWCSKKTASPAAQRDLGDRHDLPFDLAGAGAEAKLGHVAQARRLAPAGIADEVLTSAAPQEMQVLASGGLWPHQSQTMRCSGSMKGW